MPMFEIEAHTTVRYRMTIWAPSKAAISEWHELHDPSEVTDWAGDSEEDEGFTWGKVERTEGEKGDADLIIDRDGNEVEPDD